MVARSFLKIILLRDMGCEYKKSEVLSLDSLDMADIPVRAAKNAPPSPRVFPHSIPKYPMNSPKLRESMPKASEKAPMFANISESSFICDDISGYIKMQTPSINDKTDDHMISETLFLFIS
jgi:hypothetical protein